MEDPFLEFVESARLLLVGATETSGEIENGVDCAAIECLRGPSWGWVCSRILECCKAYSSGVTEAILLSDLFQAWLARSRVEGGWRNKKNSGKHIYGMELCNKQKHQRKNLFNIASIDSIYERKFVSLDAVLEVMILDIQLLKGTSSYILTLGDLWSSNSIDLYLHRKFYDLIDGQKGILRKGREVRLTGCRLRTVLAAGSSQPRLLPTEYLVALLDEEQDDDAVLLGAKFCSDTFSCIQLKSIEMGADYCFYGRLDKIGEVEVQGQLKHLKQQRLFLYDGNSDKLPLVLWDEQISLARLLSEGSMVALERPFIAQGNCSGIEGALDIYLEYGSATRLYTVPYIQHEEQVMIDSTQSRGKLKAINSLDSCMKNNDSQCSHLSQVMLPRNSQGSIDFWNFPLRLFIADIQPRMSNVSLYGVVTYINPLVTSQEIVKIGHLMTFILIIEDRTGAIDVKLHFENSWIAGEIFPGHTIFISGLASLSATENRLECVWNAEDVGASIVNITQLPALLTSSCLHKITSLSGLSTSNICMQVCEVYIGKMELHKLEVGPSHARCGRFTSKQSDGLHRCSFCCCFCDDETICRLSMSVILHDALLGEHGEVCVSCSGQSAAAMLQVSPDDFCSWPEDERALYLYSLQNEAFMVTIYWGSEGSLNSEEMTSSCWRIGHALKC